jgi:hypothetical protein
MMYSRSYIPDVRESVTPPENYDGSAFAKSAHNEICRADDTSQRVVEEECASPWQPPEVNDGAGCKEGERECSAPIRLGRGRSPLASIFSGGGILSSLGLSRIGTEEILIIATAIFLFLSKDGDRECAVMLLLLLIIN